MGAENSDEKDLEVKDKPWVLALGAADVATLLTAKQNIVERHDNSVVAERVFDGDAYLLAKFLRELNPAEAGYDLCLLIALSGDSLGPLILGNLARNGIRVLSMLFPDFPTTQRTAIHDPDGSRFVSTTTSPTIYRELTIDKVAARMREMTRFPNWVATNAFSDEVNMYLATSAKQAGVRLYAYASGLDIRNMEAFFAGCDGLVGSLSDLNHYTRNYDLSKNGAERTVKTLADKGVKSVFATDNKHGVYALLENGTVAYFQAESAQKVLSGPAANQEFAAVVFNALIKGQTVEEAARSALSIALRVQTNEANSKHDKQVADQNLKAQAKKASFLKQLLTVS